MCNQHNTNDDQSEHNHKKNNQGNNDCNTDNFAHAKLSTYHIFYHELLKLIKKHTDRGVQIKIKHDTKYNIIQLMGKHCTPKSKAINGLEDVTELAQTTAEHHPYWGLLYNSSEIANITLDKWDDSISNKEIEDIKWSIREIEHTLNNIAQDCNHFR